jgi:hypothetical protein
MESLQISQLARISLMDAAAIDDDASSLSGIAAFEIAGSPPIACRSAAEEADSASSLSSNAAFEDESLQIAVSSIRISLMDAAAADMRDDDILSLSGIAAFTKQCLFN